MSLDIINKLVELSKEKINKLDKILEYTRDQKDLVLKEETMEALEKNLEAKNKIMEEIDLIDLKYIEYFNELKEREDIEKLDELDTSKFNNLKDLKELTLSITGKLEDINRLDRENLEIFKGQFEAVKSNLKNVKNVQTAYKGYNYSQGSSMLIDEKK